MKITYVRNGIEPGDGDRRHGTTNGYKNLGCRCADCRRAVADHAREYYHRRLAGGIA